jgi:hypothetical protein
MDIPVEPMTPQQTRKWILKGIRNGERRIFTKFGDGELLCIHGANKGWHTINGDDYTDQSQADVHEALTKLCKRTDTAIGKWPDHAPHSKLRRLHADHLRPPYVDYTSLLLQEGNEEEMLSFWSSVRDLVDIDYVAPARMAPVAQWLRARHIIIADHNAHPIDVAGITASMVVVGAGLAAKPLISTLAEANPSQHLLDVGSGFDILAIGTTRQDQPDAERVRKLFKL